MTIAGGRKIRVLVVDDSPVIRGILSDNIGRAPDMEVAGTAADGRRALEVFESVRPDVVTLDIHMPHLDGMAALDAILERYAAPVIMVSSLTQPGADAALEALQRGALDYVAKPEWNQEGAAALDAELLHKIRCAAGADVRRILSIRRARRERPAAPRQTVGLAGHPALLARLSEICIAIGISTGGPPALAGLFAALRAPLPPIVVVQHMPVQFTKSLARRLDELSELSVKEAAGGDVLRPNHVLIAPGDKHVVVRRRAARHTVVLRDGAAVSGHKPSVDVLMTSVAEAFGAKSLGVIMTGMGHDGVEGCRAIRAAGGHVLGQDEATSDVYGMNKAAYTAGHVDRQFGLDEAAAAITRQAHRLLADVAAKGERQVVDLRS
jgi:two-component system, chemotaxis family, protein-glutamate methylesterase/glutaminase